MNRVIRKLGNLGLPGPLKKFFWRLAGFSVGKGVKVGWDVVLACGHAELGDHSELMPGVKVLGPEEFRLGEFTVVSRDCSLNGSGRLDIGRNCFLGHGTVLNAYEDVLIGAGTALAGAYVQVWTHSTWMEEVSSYNVSNRSEPVRIGADCYVGTGAIVLPGVTMGDGSVVGAGALVTKDVPEGTLVVGVPAKKVKKIKRTDVGKEEAFSIVREFLEKHDFQDFSFHPDDSGRVVFTWGEQVEGSFFDLKNRRCRTDNRQGVQARKLLNRHVARFKRVEE